MTAARYDAHPIRQTVAQILALQASPELADPGIGTNGSFIYSRDRVFAVAAVVQDLLEQTPASLVNLDGLDQMNQYMVGILSEVQNTIANKNFQHLVNAAAQINGAIQNQLHFIFGPPPKQRRESLAKIIKQQSDFAAASIHALTQQSATLTDRLIDAERRSDDLMNRLESIKDEGVKEAAKLSTAIANLDVKYQASEQERNKSFDEDLREFKETMIANEVSAKGHTHDLLEALRAKEQEARQLVQATGNIAVTANFQELANKEEQAANRWRIATVIFFAVGVVVALVAFGAFIFQPISFESAWATLVRFVFALVVTGPAIYTGRESAQHRTRSMQARRMHLELAAIGPFIELMPEDKQIEIREQLTKDYFGKPVEAQSVGNPVNFAEVKDLLIGVLKEVKK